MSLTQTHAIHIIFICQTLSLSHICFSFVILNSECLSPGAIISSHTSVSAAVFTLHVYSSETKDDLRQGGGYHCLYSLVGKSQNNRWTV